MASLEEGLERKELLLSQRTMATDIPVDVESFFAAPVIISGEAIESDGEMVKNPARTSETVGWVARGEAEHIEQAVAAALDAFPAWSALTPHERAEHLLKAAEQLRDSLDVESLSRVLTRENGKVLWESRVDVTAAARTLDYYAGLADRLADEITEDDRGRIVVSRRPMGVAGVIVPWNAPVVLSFQMLVPSLLAGNTVIVKPPMEAPLALSAILRILSRLLPSGVVNSVPGHGAAAGHALVVHPSVPKLSFTGSVETGQHVLEAAAKEIKRVTLELGGNDPALILQSAELDDRMFSELGKGVFWSSGQICCNVKRIYVHESHYEAFVQRFCKHIDEFVIGDGLDPRSDLGPLNSGAQRDKVRSMLDEAGSRGAAIRHLGHKLDPDAWEHGYFLLPTVVTDVPQDCAIVCKEQFGPAIPIIPVASDEDAVAAANRSEYGLTASVWCKDPDYAREVGRELQAGSLFYNVHRVGVSDVSIPYGGYKKSGLGRSHGWIPVEQNTEVQAWIQRIDI